MLGCRKNGPISFKPVLRVPSGLTMASAGALSTAFASAVGAACRLAGAIPSLVVAWPASIAWLIVVSDAEELSDVWGSCAGEACWEELVPGSVVPDSDEVSGCDALPQATTNPRVNNPTTMNTKLPLISPNRFTKPKPR